MALTTCPECEHQVSESAATCPNCGHPFHEVAPTPQATQSNPVSGPLIAALVAAGAIVIGSLLPWLSVTTIFGSVSVSGTEGDGILTLITGAVIAALAGIAFAKKSASRLTGILIIGLGAVSGLIAFNIFLNLVDNVDLVDSGVLSTIGGGLWLVILGSAVAVGGGVSLVTALGRAPDKKRSRGSALQWAP